MQHLPSKQPLAVSRYKLVLLRNSDRQLNRMLGVAAWSTFLTSLLVVIGRIRKPILDQHWDRLSYFSSISHDEQLTGTRWHQCTEKLAVRPDSNQRQSDTAACGCNHAKTLLSRYQATSMRPVPCCSCTEVQDSWLCYKQVQWHTSYTRSIISYCSDLPNTPSSVLCSVTGKSKLTGSLPNLYLLL